MSGWEDILNDIIIDDEFCEEEVISNETEGRLKMTDIPKRYIGVQEEDMIPDVLEWCDHPCDGLLLQGDVGRGKTHNACGALRKLIVDGKYRGGKFVSFPDMLEKIKSGFNKRDAKDYESECINARVLVLDDIGKEKTSEWSLGILFNIINERYQDCVPTIITTQYSGAELMKKLTLDGDDKTARAIISRLATYKAYKINGPDRRFNG